MYRQRCMARLPPERSYFRHLLSHLELRCFQISIPDITQDKTLLQLLSSESPFKFLNSTHFKFLSRHFFNSPTFNQPPIHIVLSLERALKHPIHPQSSPEEETNPTSGYHLINQQFIYNKSPIQHKFITNFSLFY